MRENGQNPRRVVTSIKINTRSGVSHSRWSPARGTERRIDHQGPLQGGVRRSLDGSFLLLLVEGETGLGKTRLLDDLQWADPATVTALSYLQRRGRAIPA